MKKLHFATSLSLVFVSVAFLIPFVSHAVNYTFELQGDAEVSEYVSGSAQTFGQYASLVWNNGYTGADWILNNFVDLQVWFTSPFSLGLGMTSNVASG